MGLIFLALIIVGITAAGLSLRSCGGSAQSDPAPVEITVFDTLEAPVPTREGAKKTDGKKKSRRKKSAAKKSVSKGNDFQLRDPFSDTIPS